MDWITFGSLLDHFCHIVKYQSSMITVYQSSMDSMDHGLHGLHQPIPHRKTHPLRGDPSGNFTKPMQLALQVAST